MAAGRRRGDGAVVERCRCACHKLFFLSFMPRVSLQFFLLVLVFLFTGAGG